MNIEETQQAYEEWLQANPDFDEELLEKSDEDDECSEYLDDGINSMYSAFEAGADTQEKISLNEIRAKQREIDELKAKVEKLESLQVDCMIDQTWFMQGTPTANLIRHAAKVYKAEAVVQNSKIEFGTDDNENWFAHDVPFFGRVQISRIEEHGLVEWDIYFGECWQGPFDSKSQCIKHLEECIQEKREEAAQGEKE